MAASGQRFVVSGFGTSAVNQIYLRSGDVGDHPKYVSTDNKYRIIKYGKSKWVIQGNGGALGYSIYYSDRTINYESSLSEANWMLRATDIGIAPIGTVIASDDLSVVPSQADTSQPETPQVALTTTSTATTPDKYLSKNFENSAFNGTYVEIALRDFQGQKIGVEYSGSTATIIEPKMSFSGVPGRWIVSDSKTNETYFLDRNSPSTAGVSIEDVSWQDNLGVNSSGTVKRILNLGEKLESQFYDNYIYNKDEIIEEQYEKYYSFGTGIVHYADIYGGSKIYETDIVGNYKQLINQPSNEPSTGSFVCASGKVYYGSRKTSMHMNKDHSTLVPFDASGTRFGFAISGANANDKKRLIKFVSLHDENTDTYDGEIVKNYVKIFASGNSPLGQFPNTGWRNEYAYQYKDLKLGETGFFTGALDNSPHDMGFMQVFSRFPILCSVDNLNDPGKHSMTLYPASHSIVRRDNASAVDAEIIAEAIDDPEFGQGNLHSARKGMFLEYNSGRRNGPGDDQFGAPSDHRIAMQTHQPLIPYVGYNDEFGNPQFGDFQPRFDLSKEFVPSGTVSGVTDAAGNLIPVSGSADNYLFFADRRPYNLEIYDTNIDSHHDRTSGQNFEIPEVNDMYTGTVVSVNGVPTFRYYKEFDPPYYPIIQLSGNRWHVIDVISNDVLFRDRNTNSTPGARVEDILWENVSGVNSNGTFEKPIGSTSSVNSIPLSKLKTTFGYGGKLRDFQIIYPYKDTHVEVSYYSGGKYHSFKKFSPYFDDPAHAVYNDDSREITSATKKTKDALRIAREHYLDGDGSTTIVRHSGSVFYNFIGDSKPFLDGSNVGPWKFVSSKPIAVFYSDDSGYANYMPGWLSDRYTPNLGANISFECSNSRWNGSDYSMEIMPQGINSIKATMNFNFLGDQVYTTNLIKSLQKRIHTDKYGDESFSGKQSYINFNEEYDGSIFLLDDTYYKNFDGSIIENLNVKNVSNEIYQTSLTLYNDRVSTFTQNGAGFVNDSYILPSGFLAVDNAKQFTIVSGSTGDLQTNKFNTYFYIAESGVNNFTLGETTGLYANVIGFKANGIGHFGGVGTFYTKWDGVHPQVKTGKYFTDFSWHSGFGNYLPLADGVTGEHVAITGTGFHGGFNFVQEQIGWVIQEVGNTNWGDILFDDAGNSGVVYYRSGVEIPYTDVTAGDTYFYLKRSTIDFSVSPPVRLPTQDPSIGNGVCRRIRAYDEDLNFTGALATAPGFYNGVQMWIGSGTGAPGDSRYFAQGDFDIVYKQFNTNDWVSQGFTKGFFHELGQYSTLRLNSPDPEGVGGLVPRNPKYYDAELFPLGNEYAFAYTGDIHNKPIPYQFVLSTNSITEENEVALISAREAEDVNYTLTNTFTGVSDNKFTRTFFFKPDREVEINYDYSNTINKFNNSISQFINIGDNKNSIKGLNLTFTNRGEEETRAILHFLESHMGFKPFAYLHDDKLINNKKVYICENWDHTFNYKGSNTINVNLIEVAFVINPFEETPPERFTSYGVPGAAEILSAISFEDFKTFQEEGGFEGVVDSDGDIGDGVTPPDDGEGDGDDDVVDRVRGSLATFKTDIFEAKPFEVFSLFLDDAGDNGINNYITNVQIGGDILNADFKTSGFQGDVLADGARFDYVIKPIDTGYNIRHFIRYQEDEEIGGQIIQFASRADFTIESFAIRTGNENGTGLNGLLVSTLSDTAAIASPGFTLVGPSPNKLYFEPDSELIDLMGSGAYFLSEIFEHRKGPTPKSNNIIIDYNDNDEQFRIIAGSIWQRYNNVTLNWDTVNETVNVGGMGLTVSGEPGTNAGAVLVFDEGDSIKDFRKQTYNLDDITSDFGTSYRLVHVYMDILSGDSFTNFQLANAEGVKKVEAYANHATVGDYSLNDRIADTGFYLYTGVTEEFEVGFSEFGQAVFEIRKFPNSSEVIKEFSIGVGDQFQAFRSQDDPNGNPAGTYPANHTFVWTLDGETIAGETSHTYTVLTEDLGKSLQCTISYTDAHGFSNVLQTEPITLGRQGDAFRMLIDTTLEVIEYRSKKYLDDINISPNWDADITTKPLEYESDDIPALNAHPTRFRLLFEPNVAKKVTIEWGDGQGDVINELGVDSSNITDTIYHDYEEPGVYEISIRGNLPLTYGRQHDWFYEGPGNTIADKGETFDSTFDTFAVYGDNTDSYIPYQQKIIEVTNWSRAHTLMHPSGMFAGAIRLSKCSSPQDMRFADNVVSTESMFEDCFCLQEIDGLQLSGIQDITEMFYNCMSLNNTKFYLSGVKNITNSFINIGKAINPMGTFDDFFSPTEPMSTYRFQRSFPLEPLEIYFYDIGDVETGRRYADGDTAITGAQSLLGPASDLNLETDRFDINGTFNQYFFLGNPIDAFYSKSKSVDLYHVNNEQNFTNESTLALMTGISGAIANGKTFWTGATPGHEDTSAPDFFFGYDANQPQAWSIDYLEYLREKGVDIGSIFLGVTNYDEPNYWYNDWTEAPIQTLDVMLTGQDIDLSEFDTLKFEIFSSESDRLNGQNKQTEFMLGLELDQTAEDPTNNSAFSLKRFLAHLHGARGSYDAENENLVSGSIPTHIIDTINNYEEGYTADYQKYSHKYSIGDRLTCSKINMVMRKLFPNVKNNFIKVTAGTFSQGVFEKVNNIELHAAANMNGLTFQRDLDGPGEAEDYFSTLQMSLYPSAYGLKPFEWLYHGTSFINNPQRFKVITDVQNENQIMYIKVGDTFEAKRIIKYSFECISDEPFYDYSDDLLNQEAHFGGKIKSSTDEVVLGRSKQFGLWDPAILEIASGVHYRSSNSRERNVDFLKKAGYFADENDAYKEFRFQSVTTNFDIEDAEYDYSDMQLNSRDDGGLFTPGMNAHNQLQRMMSYDDLAGFTGTFTDDYDAESISDEYLERRDGFTTYNKESKFRQIHGFGYVQQPEIKLSNGKVVSRGYLMDMSIQPEFLTEKGTLFNQKWFTEELNKTQLNTNLSEHLGQVYGGNNSWYLNNDKKYHFWAKVSNIISTQRDRWRDEYGTTAATDYLQSNGHATAHGTDLKSFRGINEIRIIDGSAKLVPGVNAYIGAKNKSDYSYGLTSHSSEYLDWTQDSIFRDIYNRISGNHIYTIPQLRGRVFNDYYEVQTIEVPAAIVSQASDSSIRSSLYSKFPSPKSESDFKFPEPDWSPSQFYDKENRIKADRHYGPDGGCYNLNPLVREYAKDGNKRLDININTPNQSPITVDTVNGYFRHEDYYRGQTIAVNSAYDLEIGRVYDTDPRGRITLIFGATRSTSDDSVIYATPDTSREFYRFSLMTKDYEFVDVTNYTEQQKKDLFKSDGGYTSSMGLYINELREFNSSTPDEFYVDHRLNGIQWFGRFGNQFWNEDTRTSQLWFQAKDGSAPDYHGSFSNNKDYAFQKPRNDNDFVDPFNQVNWALDSNNFTHTSGLSIAVGAGSLRKDWFSFRTHPSQLSMNANLCVDAFGDDFNNFDLDGSTQVRWAEVIIRNSTANSINELEYREQAGGPLIKEPYGKIKVYPGKRIFIINGKMEPLTIGGVTYGQYRDDPNSFLPFNFSI